MLRTARGWAIYLSADAWLGVCDSNNGRHAQPTPSPSVIVLILPASCCFPLALHRPFVVPSYHGCRVVPCLRCFMVFWHGRCCVCSQVEGSYLLDGNAIQPKEFKRMSGYVMQVRFSWVGSAEASVTRRVTPQPGIGLGVMRGSLGEFVLCAAACVFCVAFDIARVVM